VTGPDGNRVSGGRGADQPEARRLEHLWAGGFGDAYIIRNEAASKGRDAFWAAMLQKYPAGSVLEVGCSTGPNLLWIARAVPPSRIAGVDISHRALRSLRQSMPGIHGVLAQARRLPFGNARFDLVFTAGVLIHQPDATLGAVMDEIVRCSRRYVLCLEYFAERPVEVPYRGETGALFKRNYGRLYQEQHPALALRDRGFLARSEGWDDVTYWWFEKRG
jgi:pseudaminic acid biosynthesis-associated methylase